MWNWVGIPVMPLVCFFISMNITFFIFKMQLKNLSQGDVMDQIGIMDEKGPDISRLADAFSKSEFDVHLPSPQTWVLQTSDSQDELASWISILRIICLKANIQINGSQPGQLYPPSDIYQKSKDIFIGTTLGKLSDKRPGIMQNLRQCTGQNPQQRIAQPQL